jgi:hypothetical protein
MWNFWMLKFTLQLLRVYITTKTFVWNHSVGLKVGIPCFFYSKNKKFHASKFQRVFARKRMEDGIRTEKNHVVPYFNNDQTCHFRAEISHITAMIIRQFLFSMEQEDSL